MQNNIRIVVTTLAILLVATMSFSLVSVPNTSGHTPGINIPTYAYLTVAPNPIGVGQQVNVVMWAGLVLPGALVTNDVRFHDYKLIITDPDGTNQTVTWPIVTDTTSAQFYQYTPNKIGTYSFVFSYPDLNYTWTNSATYRNDVFLGATSKTIQLTVQEEQLPSAIASYPLPTEYWTRPIEGQNTYWYTIASNWLGESHPSIASGTRVQPDGTAPNSAHILWTKSIDDGGLVGGTDIGNEGNMFYSGLSYMARFANPIIMNGRLFYALPNQDTPTGSGYIAVDLRTGETLWQSNVIGVGSNAVPTFGYYYDFDSENQHGAIPPGMLFTANFAQGYDPVTGQLRINVTNVPTGIQVEGLKGEIIRYQLSTTGHWLAQWNSSKVIWTYNSLGVNQPTTVSANTSSCYDWNVTIPSSIPVSTTAQFALLDDILVGSTPFPSFADFMTPAYTMWAISLKPENRGQLLWMQNYTAPDGVTRRLPTVDPVNRVFVLRDKETMVFQGYSLDTGNHLWTSERIENSSDYEYFDTTFGGQLFMCSGGYIYHAGMAGVVYCIDTKDGKLVWTNGNDYSNPNNSTYSGFATAYGHYPQFITLIADDKVFVEAGEHSPDSPMWKGATIRSLNATTGQQIWEVMGYGGFPGRTYAAVADGIYVFNNCYNHQVTAIGKGPSAMTVDAPMTSSKMGDSITIRGTVTDISAGTTQNEQAARFPNGVPAVADASQAEWMNYVYMQKPRPTNVTGVSVILSVVDTNGNYRTIGTTTSDAYGFYSFNWHPDIEGKFTLYATFSGSESYWPSHAVTAFSIDPAAATATPQPTQTPSMADLYFLPAVIGIVLAIVIVGAVIVVVLKRKP